MTSNNIDELCVEFGFDNKMKQHIENVSRAFDILAEAERENPEDKLPTITEWLKKNMNETSNAEEVQHLSEREKFIFSFGILNGILMERLDLD